MRKSSSYSQSKKHERRHRERQEMSQFLQDAVQEFGYSTYPNNDREDTMNANDGRIMGLDWKTKDGNNSRGASNRQNHNATIVDGESQTLDLPRIKNNFIEVINHDQGDEEEQEEEEAAASSLSESSSSSSSSSDENSDRAAAKNNNNNTRASSSSSSSSTIVDSFIQRQQQTQKALDSAKNYLYPQTEISESEKDAAGKNKKKSPMLPLLLTSSTENYHHHHHHDESSSSSSVSYIENPQWYHKKQVLHRIILVLSILAIGSTYEFVTTIYKAIRSIS